MTDLSPSELITKTRETLRKRYAGDWRRAIMKGRLWIKTESAEKVRLVPNAVQTELIDLIWEKWQANEPVRIIVPKPRREGISTISEAIIYSITAFNSNYNSYLLGYNDENAREIFEMTKRMHDNLEIALRPETKASNAKELVFSGTDSKIVIGSAQNKEIRGKGVSAFHGSEVAFYPNAKETMGGLLQSIPDLPHTLIILESTGNGVGNWFERRCRMAEKGEGGYTLFFIPWYRNQAHATTIPDNYQLIPGESGRYGNEVKLLQEHPQITLEQLFWRRNTIDDKCDGDLQFFMQEYPATLDECFQASGTNVFDLPTLAKIQHDSLIPTWQGVIQGLKFMISPTARGWLKVWHKPATEQWRNRYVIGADTGGVWDGADYSVAYVWDRIKRCVCATVHGHFEAYEYREYLVALSKWYQNAVIAVEINRDKSETDDMGNTVIDAILRDYPTANMYTRKVVDDQTKSETSKVGWHTSHQTKQMIVDRLRRFVNEYEFEPIAFNDYALIDEMKTYIITRTPKGVATWNAQEGAKDDRVMAFGITLCVSETEPPPKLITEYKSQEHSISPMEAIA